MKKIITGIAAALIVLTAAAIFIFSSQDGAESADLSTRVTRIISGFIFRDFGEMSHDEQRFIVSELEPFIRKLAHFTEYALLGAAVYALLLAAGPRFIRRKGLASLTAAAVFASADELNQYFVPERSGNIADVLIDTCGAAVGIVIVSVIVIIVKYVRERISEK